jgi:hypothetical protein
VIESFSPIFDNDGLVDHGIYFFSHRDRRVLRHIKYEDVNSVVFCNIISRPFEMWVQTFECIEYHGPSCDARPDDLWLQESMDEALWMAGRGEAKAAVDYMRMLDGELDTPGLISGRTILHYAAKEGKAEAVREILKSGFDNINSLDAYCHSALRLAVSELHLDVVEVLLKEWNADPMAGEPVLGDIGDYVKYRPYANNAARTKDEIQRIVPSIVQMLIEKNSQVAADAADTVFGEACVLSSPSAVRMLCSAVEADCYPSCEYLAYVFGSFRNRTQELSAVDSFRVLVQEFNIDINEMPHGPWHSRVSAVVTMAKQGIAESVIMAIDHLGADPTSKDVDGRSIREIALERANRQPVDVNGMRILSFLDERGL